MNVTNDILKFYVNFIVFVYRIHLLVANLSGLRMCPYALSMCCGLGPLVSAIRLTWTALLCYVLSHIRRPAIICAFPTEFWFALLIVNWEMNIFFHVFICHCFNWVETCGIGCVLCESAVTHDELPMNTFTAIKGWGGLCPILDVLRLKNVIKRESFKIIKVVVINRRFLLHTCVLTNPELLIYFTLIKAKIWHRDQATF